jgi:hypothetical protein
MRTKTVDAISCGRDDTSSFVRTNSYFYWISL